MSKAVNVLLIAILAASVVLHTCSSAAADYPLTLDDMTVRDPFIHADVHSKTYYLYAQTGNRGEKEAATRGVEAYRSRDLVHWSRPALVFEKPNDFWGGNEIWAPEMHKLGDHYYLFVSFNGREGGRGTQILRANSPAGPFTVFSLKANTPPEQRALDGTPFIDESGRNWLVYCHEWVQIGDGAMLAIRMSDDWSRRVGEPIHLFHASDAPWVRPLGGKQDKYVTDGCFLHRTADHRLLMIWASFTGEKGHTYAVGVVRSESGTIQGPWKHLPDPLFAAHGGHAMLFRTFQGRLLLTLHQPNSGGPARAKLFAVQETADPLEITAAELEPSNDPDRKSRVSSTEPQTDSGAGTCFGTPNDFSGKLSDDQDSRVPKSLRGAFYIESVRPISAAELAKKMQTQTKLAQESHDGIDYVALQDYRCVEFEGGVSGLMIVVERYRVVGD